MKGTWEAFQIEYFSSYNLVDLDQVFAESLRISLLGGRGVLWESWELFILLFGSQLSGRNKISISFGQQYLCQILFLL